VPQGVKEPQPLGGSSAPPTGTVINPDPYGQSRLGGDDVITPGENPPGGPPALGSPILHGIPGRPDFNTGITHPGVDFSFNDFWNSLNPPVPGSPDMTGAAERQANSSRDAINAQTQQNRPGQTNAFGSSTTWTIGPDGRPMQTQSFGGQMGSLAGTLQGQALDAAGNPLPGGFSLDPSSARDQAITGAYNQATSRLDPQFRQREQALRSQLLNQGLDPSSEAFQTAMGNFGRERNDAYSTAMNGAIAQGTQAGESLFNQGLSGHQQAMADALLGKTLPLQQLGSLGGFLGMPNFSSAGASDPAQYLAAALGQGNMDLTRYGIQKGNAANMVGGGMDLLKTLGTLLTLGG
jgi:hypothetical protein